MNPDIIVPFRSDGGGLRDQVWAWLQVRWEELGWPIIIGEMAPDEEWVKAEAVRRALLNSTAEVIVLLDADVWCNPTAMWDAAMAIESGEHAWAIPHESVFRLTEESSEIVRQTEVWEGRCERMPYLGVIGGGLVMMRRTFYDTAPFDPRFKGWGHEDQAAGLAWETIAGRPFRGFAKLWHLWHPRQPRETEGMGSLPSKLLLDEYIRATGNQEQMQRLVHAARQEQEVS